MKCVKIRIRGSKELLEFASMDEGFTWVRNNRRKREVLSVLIYDSNGLADMTRWYYDGQYFKRENIVS